MSYIGSGANRLSEIAARCNEPATNLSHPLKKLIDLGFLERDVPFGIEEKNAKKSLYKIADPFMAFYYQFVVPNRSFIVDGGCSHLRRHDGLHFHAGGTCGAGFGRDVHAAMQRDRKSVV